MKKTFLIIALFIASISITACNSQEKKEDSHTHDDGSTHDDHIADTASVNQEEFKVDSAQADTAGAHSHENGEKHTH